jgi:hypothetical protein
MTVNRWCILNRLKREREGEKGMEVGKREREKGEKKGGGLKYALTSRYKGGRGESEGEGSGEGSRRRERRSGVEREGKPTWIGLMSTVMSTVIEYSDNIQTHKHIYTQAQHTHNTDT